MIILYNFYSVFKQERSACGGMVACDKTSLYAMFRMLKMMFLTVF